MSAYAAGTSASQGSPRPVIGITTYVEPASWAAWVDVPAALVPHAYVRQVEEAGGVALLVPPRGDADEAFAHEVLDRLVGLVLAGGADVEPRRYGAQRDPAVLMVRPDRDDLELLLARVSGVRRLPVLGICRGMQVMAVAAGGLLEQHLPDRAGTIGHLALPGAYTRHRVTTVEGTRVAEVLGTSVDVPSSHHQGVLAHPGYRPAAWASDGTLEAMEDPEQPFRLAVQWHPEAGDDPRLFEALVAAAREVARGR
ncbi:MAG: gamma-glutamyl-gamma-aminobutyrate hydrolase family protein [Lapillicoccus sp.]